MGQEERFIDKENPFTTTVVCEHKVSTPPGNFQYHMHNEFEVYFFLGGDVNFIVEQRVYTLNPGDILLFNNTEFHHPTFRSNAEYVRMVLHFNPAFAQQFSTQRSKLLRCFLSRPQGEGNLLRLTPEEREPLFRLAHKIEGESQSGRVGDDVLAAAHLMELLVLLERAPRHGQQQPGALSPHVQRALAYITERLPQPVSLAEVAKALCVDRFYLSKAFKREMGTTLYHYVLLKRLNLARVRLAQGSSVTEACVEAGFNDYSNFIRTFKKYTGTTPLAFSRGTNPGEGAFPPGKNRAEPGS